MEAILIPMTFFLVTFGIMYVFFTTRNKERLAMIEKGADPSIFQRKHNRSGIKLGLLAIGVAIGVLMGQMIAHFTQMDIEAASVSMSFLCGGFGLVLEHYLARKENKEN